MLFAFLSFLWWACGVGGFVFWWTGEHDLTTQDLGFAILVGAVLGPFTWLMGWFIHGTGRILLRARKG